MKTPLFLLSLLSVCGLLAQPDVGVYPSTTWASTNLLINRALETGQLGLVVGYTDAGKLGVVSGGGVLEAPDNGLYYARRNKEWQNFIPAGGGTSGGTNRMKVAAMAEFRPSGTNGTLIPANSATFIRINHIFDPDGIITQINTNTGSFRLVEGAYAITMVVPTSVAEQGGGNVRIPFNIGLFDLTTTNDVYYQTYTLYDEDLSQYSQVFMPYLATDGTHDYTIRVLNHSPTIDIQAGQAGNVAGVENHYTEIQFLKLDGIAGLPEAPINSLMYARSNQDWMSFTIPSTNGFIGDAPLDSTLYARTNGTWGQFTTTWALTNLLVNRALETGQVGQAIGYLSNGLVGTLPRELTTLSIATGYTNTIPVTATTLGFAITAIGPVTLGETHAAFGARAYANQRITVKNALGGPINLVKDTSDLGTAGSNLKLMCPDASLRLGEGQCVDFVANSTADWVQAGFVYWSSSSDLGLRDSLAWNHAQLMVNAGLASGLSGQAIGYTSNGVVGPIAISSGQDTNAVASVKDLTELAYLNGYNKAMVGWSSSSWTAWQLRLIEPAKPEQVFTNLSTESSAWDEGYGACFSSGQNYLTNITWRVSVSSCVTPNTYALQASEPGRRYRFDGYIKRINTGAAMTLVAGPLQTDFTPMTTVTLPTSYVFCRFEFTATATNSLMVAVTRDMTGLAPHDASITLPSFTALAVEAIEPNGSNIIASAVMSGYAWQQVTCGPTQDVGTVVTDAYVWITNNSQTLPLANYIRMGVPSMGYYTLTSNDILVDGSVDQQKAYVLYDSYYGDTGSIRIPRDADGTDGVGSNMDAAEGTGDIVMTPRIFYTYSFDLARSLWILGAENTLVATLLPAPWPPPDSNGVQLLPAKIRDQLVVELLPYLLTNYARLFPHGPGLPSQLPYTPSVLPMPRSSRANPLDVSGFVAPPSGAPTYHVEINVGGTPVEGE